MTRYYHSPIYTCRVNSATKILLKIFRLTLFAIAVFFVTSCEEEPTVIGEKLYPGSDLVKIESTDTLRVKSFTMYDKSVETDNLGTSYIGQIYDPYFGTTTAGFVSQIRLSSVWDDQPFTIDSIKLVLALLDVKGVTTSPHYLRLSEIDEEIYVDSAYYSDKDIPLASYVLSDIELPVLKPDTINYIAINIDTSFALRLTEDTSMFFYSSTKPDFRSYFKGLYFEMVPSVDPLLISLSLVPQAASGGYNNYFVLYMHDVNGNKKEFFFILDAINTNASYGKFSHNFSTATSGRNLEEIINIETEPATGDTLSYLQNLDGVYTKIVLPGLEKIKNDPSLKDIAVNKARITIPIFFDGDIYKASTVPSTLGLRYIDKDGKKAVVSDYANNSSFFDGKIDSTANVYNFNIPAFVQEYLNDASNTLKPELEIYQGAGSRNVILKGNSSKTPVKFELTYSKF